MAIILSLLKWLGILLGVLIVAAVIFIAVTDWNWLKNYIASKGSAQTGRQLSIEEMDVDWSWRPLITLKDIRFENASWSEQPNMVEIQRLQVRIALKELLFNFRTVLPEIILTKPQIILEKSPEGKPNWEFTPDPGAAVAAEATTPEERGDIPVIGQLIIDEGRAIYRDPEQDMDITAVIATAKAETEGAERKLEVEGKGRYQGEPFRLTVQAGSLLALRETEKPYPLDVEVSIGNTRATVEGTVTEPVALKGLDLDMTLQGPDPAKLFPILGIPTPSMPPYKVKGHLDRQGDTWLFRDFAGTLGNSDLKGNISVDTGKERKFLRADLTSDRLDFDDLAGFVGAEPATGPGEAAAEEQRRQAQEKARRDRVLPNEPIDLERLRAMDAQVTFKGEKVIAPNLPLNDLSAELKLEDGQLSFTPLNFGVAGGDVQSEIHIDGSKKPVEGSLKIKVKQVNLKGFLAQSEIAKKVEAVEKSFGTIGGQGEVSGTGASVAEFLGSADGHLALIMNGGQLDSLLIEAAGLDIGEALLALTAKDRNIAIRCMVAGLKMQDGLTRLQPLVLDTTDTIITGRGTINFQKETLNVVLEPKPKDVSILSARSPIHIEGTFKDPAFFPEPGPLAARGAAAAALSVLLTPLAALVALVEPGTGEDAHCHQLIERAQQGR